MVIVVPLAIVIVAWQFYSKVDRTDPIKVATAFTKALHSKNVSGAAKYFVPDQAQSWEDDFGTMKSGATERYFERIPAEPAYGAPVTSKEGVTTVQTADKQYSLEMKQIDGKWYVSRTL
jgi:hypothetical protein